MLFLLDQAPSSMEDNPIAETREGGPQDLPEKVQEKLKEIFA
jgi:hypothetical protein